MTMPMRKLISPMIPRADTPTSSNWRTTAFHLMCEGCRSRWRLETTICPANPTISRAPYPNSTTYRPTVSGTRKRSRWRGGSIAASLWASSTAWRSRCACRPAPVISAFCSPAKRNTTQAPTVSNRGQWETSIVSTWPSNSRSSRSSAPIVEISNGPLRTSVLRPSFSSRLYAAHSRIGRCYAGKFAPPQGARYTCAGAARAACAPLPALAKARGLMTSQLDKTFDPAAIEAKWYAYWEANGCFRPERPEAQSFTLVNPPPNVTGSLHIGHALDNTLQDVVIRYERLRGKDALWVVGTDHAGIATQMVVERQLEERQDKRTNYSREDFVQKVWEWKAESGGTITGQLRRLGCSMDWSREQFTMDPHFTRAVTKVFVDLYNEGLIYRDKRLVNWDPKLKTAISDLEVETRDVQGHFWHLKYPLASSDPGSEAGAGGYISVATTRPETMLADMAVAVHPSDARYAHLVAPGAEVILPLTGRRIPIVADEHADPELGSGAVKITPGHDFNDFEVGKRAGFRPGEMLNMFDAEARVVQTADGLIPAEFVGLDRFDARKLVVERMKEQGFLVPHVTKDKDGEVTEH